MKELAESILSDLNRKDRDKETVARALENIETLCNSIIGGAGQIEMGKNTGAMAVYNDNLVVRIYNYDDEEYNKMADDIIRLFPSDPNKFSISDNRIPEDDEEEEEEPYDDEEEDEGEEDEEPF